MYLDLENDAPEEYVCPECGELPRSLLGTPPHERYVCNNGHSWTG